MTYLFAVLAACANAVSSVLQRKASRDLPHSENLSWRLIRDLLHTPVWFGGILSVIAGFLLQATALSNGALSVVEPVLVLELPATLLLATWVFGARLGRREWGSTIAMTTGLAGLLYFLSPSAGTTGNVRWYVWTVGIGANLLFVAALVAVALLTTGWEKGSEGGGARRAALLGTATGSMFGLAAALIKGVTNTLAVRGFLSLFTTWHVYAMIAAGAAAMFMLQSALNAGRLIAAQPAITLADPIVSILWGILGFNESVRGGVYIALAVLAGLIMSASVITLGCSPHLHGAAGEMEDDRAGQPDRGNDGEQQQPQATRRCHHSRRPAGGTAARRERRGGQPEQIHAAYRRRTGPMNTRVPARGGALDQGRLPRQRTFCPRACRQRL